MYQKGFFCHTNTFREESRAQQSRSYQPLFFDYQIQVNKRVQQKQWLVQCYYIQMLIKRQLLFKIQKLLPMPYKRPVSRGAVASAGRAVHARLLLPPKENLEQACCARHWSFPKNLTAFLQICCLFVTHLIIYSI